MGEACKITDYIYNSAAVVALACMMTANNTWIHISCLLCYMTAAENILQIHINAVISAGFVTADWYAPPTTRLILLFIDTVQGL